MKTNRAHSVVASIFVVAFGACLAQREGRVGIGTGDPTAAPPLPPASCDVTSLVVGARGTIDRGAAPDLIAPSFQLGTDAIVVAESGTSGSNAPSDFEVVRVVPGSDAHEQLTFNDVDDAVIAVDGDAMLILRGPRTPFGSALVVREPSGETVLANDVQLVLPMGEGESRWLSSPATIATWTECEGADWACASLRASVFHDGRVEVLRTWLSATHAQVFYTPEVAGEAVVWAEREDHPDALWTVMRWTRAGGEEMLARDLALIAAPRVSGDVLFAPTTDGMERVVLGTGGAGAARTVIAPGQCSAAETPRDGRERALFGCAPAASEPWPAFPPLLPTPLYYWDGAALHTLAGGAGGAGGAGDAGTSGAGASTVARVASPKVDGDLLAWIAYDDADVGCDDMQTAGRVIVASADRPELAVAVADVGVGCLCCNAYWPSPQLGLDAGLVVWNYADTGVEGGRPFVDAPLGYARVTAARDCHGP